ncbi:MAG TPA: nuclear transport factor 2 family protein, partial [Anaerolineales bacterium]|nr:nuclear transport factor 2 family protein [Anaerolineales bacterium]
KLKKIEPALRAAIDFHSARNRQDFARMRELCTENCLFDPTQAGQENNGQDALVNYWQDFFAQHPTAHFEIEQVYGYDPHCVLRWRVQLGNSWERGVDLFRVKNQQICEILTYQKSPAP